MRNMEQPRPEPSSVYLRVELGDIRDSRKYLLPALSS